MADVLVLTEKELRACVELDSGAVDMIAEAFATLATKPVQMPPILRMDMEERRGEVDVKTAYVPGLDGFAVKVSPGFFDNPKKGLATTNGLMTVHSAETGVVQAVLLDNGYLTDVRTAAAGAVAARCLAPESVSTLGIVGAGMQARLQAKAFCLERKVDRILVWGRDPDGAAKAAQEITRLTGRQASVSESLSGLVREADAVVTATPSRKPLIDRAMLHPGLHITAMGADAEQKNELAPEVVAEAELFVCDKHEQSARLGELHHAVGAGLVPEDMPVTELGEIVAGLKPGRTEADQITVCDLTGTGVQDTAIAVHALKVAREKGFGTVVST
ncbi:MAG: cyclodeaminase [Marivibrio sp.]|uniref:cyclodeaminase n=1 Tax=Marivibrio sp. TaxID=2039719 RepID=UPI0032EB5575